MRCLLLFWLLFCSGCTILTEHPDKEVDLNTIDITVCSPGFLQTGWTCAELNGYPQWVHPVLIQLFGCAISYYDNTGAVVQATVFADFDMALEHELGHLKGHHDGSEQLTYDPVKVKHTQDLIDAALKKYADTCYHYEKP